MKIPALAALAATFVMTTALPAHADNRLAVSAGIFDVIDNDDSAADFRLDYKWNDPLFFQIKPFIGAEATTDGAVYGLGGLYADWGFSPHWYLTPSIGGGLYFHGDGKRLGDTVEFRTQLDVSYEFENTDRLGVGYSQISNFGLGDDNPGTGVLLMTYSIPIRGF